MCDCSPSFRVVFDEKQREHIVLALQRRLQDLEGRLGRSRRAESCRGFANQERIEADIECVREAIVLAVAESF